MKAKILISDDEKVWREDMLGNLLRDEGYIVRAASTIEETVEAIKKEFFHVVTVDLSFSDDHSVLEGKETMQILKKMNEGTKAIVLTAHGTVDVAVESLKDFNVFNFLQKGTSFDDDKFLEVVANAVKEVTIGSINTGLTMHLDTIISGHTLAEIASKIGEHESEVKWLIKNLIKDTYPVIFHPKDSEILKTDNGSIFQRYFWSRLLGKSLILSIGSAEAMEGYYTEENQIINMSTTEKAKGYIVNDNKYLFSEYK